jgi:hypothetical protein
MKAMEIGIEDKVDALLVCLEKDIEHLQVSLAQLNELRRLVIKRDDIALGQLLERIQAEENQYRSQERNRQSTRKELATALGCDPEQMTLSTLEAKLPERRKKQVAQTKTKLRSLIEDFKKEHMSIALLLSECARFNNLLLRSIFDLGKAEVVCYNANGATKRQTDMALVNLQL